ncbi:MAG: beta-propeller fold lactonase family protein [Candidatus Calescibacterium sp.]|nr:beta-propeller fold lactonase family protein [Candidatus Calescibacterium sp.]MDW8087492.1 beta-propeller fold lactonase family protein [Candidatus Calescibacterium sp.]
MSKKLLVRFKTYIKEISATPLPFVLLLSSFSFLSSCAKEDDNKAKTEFKPPEKIVLGGEALGKIALIKNGKIHKIQTIQGAVFHQVMFSKDGKYIFAAASNHNKVYVFDGENLDLVKEIPVGEHPSHMDLDDSGEILAVNNEDSGSVSFISVSKLEEVNRVSGLSIPHFPRYYNGFWFISNFGAPKISVINKDKIEFELTDPKLPECAEGEECAFFDVSIRKDIGQGLASHTQTGYIVDFDAKNIKINKIITNQHPKISSIYTRDNMEAFKTMISPFDSVGWTVFRGGVVLYDFVARDVYSVWKYQEEFSSQFGIEYPGKIFVLLQDKNKIAILNRFGALEKIVNLDGIPGEGIYYNNYVYVFVIKKGSTDIIALDGDGNVHKIAETDFEPAEGIHIPGAYPHCH